MPEIKLIEVLSFSDEEKQFPVQNLLRPQSYKRWKCKAGEKKAFAILKLEKTTKIQSFDIGNEASAFVEILGNRSSSEEDDFTVILPTVAFMTPEECRNQKNMNTVRFFDCEKFTKEGREEKWDRIKVVCTQTSNQNLAFGLSFIRVHAPSPEEEDEKRNGASRSLVLGKFKLKDDVDESGISKTARSDFAPGALFSAKRKASQLNGINSEGASKSVQSEPPAKKRISSLSTDNRTATSASGDGPKKTRPSSSSKETHSVKKDNKPKVEIKNKKSDVQFNKLLDGVVFVLSGFQNPIRSELRDKAIEMGAQYRPDWTAGCTHLICAFSNTPKYNQVKGMGKIVKKEWIMDSHKMKQKMDWRKYAFETNGDSSDEEKKSPKPKVTSATRSTTSRTSVVSSSETASVKPKKPSTSVRKDDLDPFTVSTDYSEQSHSGEDTDEEISRVKSLKKATSPTKPTSTTPKRPSPRKPSLSGNSNQKKDLPMLPDFFTGMHFFLYGGFSNEERKQLQRFVVAFGGVPEEYMGNKVTHVLTREKWDDNFDEALAEFPNIVFLSPEFVLMCGKGEKMVGVDEYKVKKGSK